MMMGMKTVELTHFNNISRKLPEGWELVPLGTITDVIMGQSPPGKSYNSEGKGLPFFQGKAEFGDLLPTPVKWCTEPKKISQPGDVLISVRAPVGPTNMTREESCIGRGLAAIRPGNGLNTKYLLYALRALENSLSKQGTGSTFGAIGKKLLSDFAIPVPRPIQPSESLQIQRRIVARIEAFMAEIKKARQLLDQMRYDSEVIVEAKSEEALSGLGTIPFQALVKSYKNGIYKPKHYYGRGYPSARMFNIKDGEVNLDGAPLLDVTPDELDTYGLKDGDILINRVNSRELVGKSGWVSNNLGPCTFESKNIRVRIHNNLADPAFIVIGLNSTFVKKQILQKQKPAIGQATINQSDLNELEIPFSSDIKEQKKIVDDIMKVKAEVDEMRCLQQQDIELLNQLEQSILERAFRGEL